MYGSYSPFAVSYCILFHIKVDVNLEVVQPPIVTETFNSTYGQNRLAQLLHPAKIHVLSETASDR